VATDRTDLHYKKLPDGTVVLTETYKIGFSPLPLTTLTVEIPKGFVWDGATIPIPARWIIGNPLQAEFIVPSLIHDWYCERTNSTIARTLADAVFWELLRMERVPRWKRFAMWFGVRVWSLLFVWRPFRA
jgi:hypothetical protein